jgi:putative solute:sodium symporter small subunit
VDRKFILTAFGYANIGLALGIYMAASHNHKQLVTHAHIMLVGFVVSFIYGLCHKLWLDNTTSTLAVAQYYLHQAGSLALFVGLFLLYGGLVEAAAIDPVLGIASVVVLVGVVMMRVLFIKSAHRA